MGKKKSKKHKNKIKKKPLAQMPEVAVSVPVKVDPLLPIKRFIAEIKTTLSRFGLWVRTTVTSSKTKIVAQYNKLILWKKQRYLKTLIYLLRIEVKFRGVKSTYSKKGGFFLRAFLILIFEIIWRFLLLKITYPITDPSPFFIAMAAMSGGALAITFTISIFAQQRSADFYSSKFFNVYVHNTVEKLTYFLITFITLGLFFMGGKYDLLSAYLGANFLINLSLLLVLLVFCLIDWQYEDVRKKSNPITAIDFIERQASIQLNKGHKYALRLAKILRLGTPTANPENALASAYSLSNPHLQTIGEYISTIFEISNKLFSRGEILAGKRGLRAAASVLTGFLKNRKNSFVASPSPEYILAVQTDSEKFLTPVLENLNAFGGRFINAKDSANAAYIVEIYKILLSESKDVGFINRTGENPILDRIFGYLTSYADFAIRNQDQEVLLSALYAYELVGKIALQKKLNLTYYGVHQHILAIANYGLTVKKTFLADRAFACWHSFIKETFTAQSFVGIYHLDAVIKNIAQLSANEFNFHKAGHLTRNETLFSLTKGFDNYFETIDTILNGYNDVTVQAQKDFYVENIVKLFEKISENLRQLPEKILSADNLLTEVCARLIYFMNHIILQLIPREDFINAREVPTLERVLSRNIHIPSWFSHHAVKIDDNNNFTSLIESVAKTGVILVSMEAYTPVKMKACIASLWSMTQHALEKMEDNYGYSTPRIMLRLCYMGILAFKQGDQENFLKVKEHVTEFEARYKVKFIDSIHLPEGIDPKTVHGLPTADRLQIEIIKWRSEFGYEKANLFGYRDDSESWLYSVIDEADIDWFTFEVWGFIPEYSSIEKEIEKKMKKVQESVPKEVIDGDESSI